MIQSGHKMFELPAKPLHKIPTLEESIKDTLSTLHPPAGAPSISEFYADREILITGASGFLGKTLLEKLLRSCSKIKRIFLLIRPSKGKSVDERLQEMMKSQLFDTLRRKESDFLTKLIPIEGEISKIGLGISPADLDKLKNVSIIFHVAATVKFDEHLRDAVLINTRGTREILELALKLKNLKVFCHVSTAFTNATKDKEIVEEKLYQPLMDWRKMIKICENYDDDTLDPLNEHFLNGSPNTYVFTKNLAEHVVNDYSEKIKSVIVRPSVVLNSIREPIPGDNFKII